MRLALLILLLFAPLAANADPVTVVVGEFLLAADAIGVSALTLATIGLTVGSAIYGSAQQRRAERRARDAYNAGLQARTATGIATDAPHRYIYGRARVGSDVVAMFTSGDKDQYRHLVCVHAAHECDAIEEIYINGEALGPLDVNGNVIEGKYVSGGSSVTQVEQHTGSTITLSMTPTANSVKGYTLNGPAISLNTVWTPVTIVSVNGNEVVADVPAGTAWTVSYLVPYGGTPTVRVIKHLGTPDDPADAYLMSQLPAGVWPSTAVLRGLCYTVVTLDLNNQEFQGGLPSIQARIRGRKLYDPRNPEAAPKWSQNPALAIWDYLTSPLCGVSSSDLPVAQFIAAANVCDDASYFGDGRYTINGTVTSDQDQTQTLEKLAQCMAGGIVATTWSVWAGAYVAPVMSLVQSDIVGSLSITPGISGASIYNGVKGQYAGSENNYMANDFPPYQNANFRTADGVDYYTNIDFPFTDTQQRVANLAAIFIEDSRNAFTITADFSLKAWPLQIGDRVTLTSDFIGQSGNVYRVTDKKFSPNSAVQLTLKEDGAGIWDYANDVTPFVWPTTNLPDPFSIETLGGINCTSGDATLLVQSDGSIVPRILVTWPVATTQAIYANGEIEVQYCPITPDMSWTSVTVPGDHTQVYLSPVTAGLFYAVRARCYNVDTNVRGPWVNTTYQVLIHSGTATVYQWAESRPDVPSGAESFDWSSGLFGAAPSGWSLAIPSSPPVGTTLWEAQVSLSDLSGASSTAFDWSQALVSPVGYSPASADSTVNVTVFAYQRSATAPSGTPGACVYTFPTSSTPGAITTPSGGVLANGWTTYIPDGAGALWVTQVLASASTATVNIAADAWSSAAKLAQDGANGADGLNTATARLYQWAPTTPARPTGTSTLTWASVANGSYTGSDGWSIGVPANPGTPGLRLYVASVPLSAAASVSTSTVSYTSATVEAWSQNGADGVSGVQSATATVYQWAATIPAGPAGSALFNWSSRLFGSAPSGWSLTPGTSPSAGMTLWAASVQVTDTAGVTGTDFNWSSAAVMAVGYAGTNGGPGQQGASYVTAYCASATGSATSAPAQTTGKTSLPADNSGGITGTWSATVPTLTDGQMMYQSDGIYDPATNQVTWSIPYWSSLKVATLSAITANLGAINAGSINLGGGVFTVDNDGNLVCSSITIKRQSDGKVILTSNGLTVDGAAPGTLNSDLTPAINSAAGTANWTGVNGRPSDDSIKNNLIDLSWWQRLGALAWSQNSEYNVLADSLNDYGLPGPKGVADTVWYCKETTGDSDGGGGWNSAFFNLDITKTYRFVVPIRRVSGNGQSYWGTNGVADLNTTTQTVNGGNPYFADQFLPNSDRWYLFVGYIYPANSTGHTSDGSGVWDCKTGQKIGAGTNYCFMPDGRQVNHRAYQYYAAQGSEHMFGRPMINVVDGTEPSLREYFEAGAVLNTSITMNADGSISGAGGGQVTLPGMGQNTFRVVAKGDMALGAVSASPGFYINGSLYAGSNRSYVLVAIRRTDLAIVWSQYYDVFGVGETNGKTATDLANDLNTFANSPGQYILVMWTHDEPQSHRLDSGLPAAVYRNGGSAAIFGSSQFAYRSAYGLVAISGCGEGNGAEFYQGTGDGDPNAWIDFSFNMLNGELVSVSGGYTPRSLQDYGYVGDLNATVGAPAGTNVGSTPAQTVESNAASGASAAAALPGMNTIIDRKLNKDSTDTLTGQIGLQSQYALLVGDATNGVWMGSGGIFMVQGGVVKASLPISGNPTFAGQLLAAFGTFGAIAIAAGGSLALQASAYNSDPGIWLGFVGSTPKFSIVDSSGAKLLFDPTASQPIQIVNANVSGGSVSGSTGLPRPSATGTAPISSLTGTNGVKKSWNITVTASGGSGGYSYAFSLGPGTDSIYKIAAGFDVNVATVSATGTNTQAYATVVCVVTDSNGLSTTFTTSITSNWGTPA